MLSDDQKFHWSEGMKYAFEGIKSFFYLNGAASIAVLTFVGHTGTVTRNLICAMVLFALGALAASFSYAFAYLTQLHYGNETIKESAIADKGRLAGKLHWATYCVIGLSALFFLVGILVSAKGFLCELP